MTTYIIRRLVMAVIVLIIVSLMVFIAMRLLPGDPIRMLVTQSEQQEFTEQQIRPIKASNSAWTDPLMVQYFTGSAGFSTVTSELRSYTAPR